MAFGFELRHGPSGRCWQLVCDSHVEERAWLRELARPRGADGRPLGPAAAAATVTICDTGSEETACYRADLFDMFLPVAERASGDILEEEEEQRQRAESLGELRESLMRAIRPPSEITQSSGVSAHPERQTTSSCQQLASSGGDGCDSAQAKDEDPVPPPPSLSGSTKHSCSSAATSFGQAVEGSPAAASVAVPQHTASQEQGEGAGAGPAATTDGVTPKQAPPAAASAAPQAAEITAALAAALQPPGADAAAGGWPRNEELLDAGAGLLQRPLGHCDSDASEISEDEDGADLQSPSSAGIGGASTNSVGSPTKGCDCIGRLEMLDRRLEEQIDRLQQKLQATEADCRAMLQFFGLEAPGTSRLSFVVENFLDSLWQFVQQVKAAWEELERHKRRKLTHSRGGSMANSVPCSGMSTPNTRRASGHLTDVPAAVRQLAAYAAASEKASVSPRP